MVDDRLLQRGLLLAEIEEAEAELSRLAEKASRVAETIREVAEVVEEARPFKGDYNHPAAKLWAERKKRVKSQSRYRDSMSFDDAMELVDEIEEAKRTLAELRARKSDANFRRPPSIVSASP